MHAHRSAGRAGRSIALLALLLAASCQVMATEFREIVSSPLADGAPGWSPDGETIVFSSYMSGDWEVYTVGAWGGEVHNFSQHPATDIYPNWSPAGDWIAFTSRRDNGQGDEDMDLWIQSPDGLVTRCLTEHPGYDNFAAFDPSGTRIAFSSDREGWTEIWVMDLDTPETATRVSSGLDHCIHATWSPDGLWIAFDARIPGEPGTNAQLYRVPAAGGEVEAIPTGLLANSDPGWSPGGRFLAFAGGNHVVDWDLWFWDFQNQGLIQITNSRESEQSPSWNAAGTEIVYARVESDNKDVWVAYELPVTSVKPGSASGLKSLFRR